MGVVCTSVALKFFSPIQNETFANICGRGREEQVFHSQSFHKTSEAVIIESLCNPMGALSD